MGVKT
ncbi:hypothetical protein VCEM1626_001701A, partial [Vibrio cholerae O1 str. EM-1626]